MSPEAYFAFALIVRMIVTAVFLLTATIIAERAGPLIGGLIATLPISAGPIYVFLALDHDTAFVAQSALASVVTNAVNIALLVAYVLLAQKRSAVASIGGAFALWVVLMIAISYVNWTVWLAVALNVATLAVALPLVHSLRHVRVAAVPVRWYDFVLRAGMVAALVGLVGTLSFTIGPTRSGNLAAFPIVLTCIMLVLHPRIGGPATAAILANAVIGLGGFAVVLLLVHLAAMPLGAPFALCLALAFSIGFNLLIYVVRRRAVSR